MPPSPPRSPRLTRWARATSYSRPDSQIRRMRVRPADSALYGAIRTRPRMPWALATRPTARSAGATGESALGRLGGDLFRQLDELGDGGAGLGAPLEPV